MSLATDFFSAYPQKLSPLFKEQFKFLKRPKYFTAGFDYIEGDKKYSFYLDIENSGLILKANFVCPVDDFFNAPFFQIVCQMVEGLPVSEAKNISAYDLIAFCEQETMSEKGELWDIFLQMVDDLMPFDFPLLIIPLMLLNNTIDEFLGREKTWQENWQKLQNKNETSRDFKKSQALLCRCFGIFYSDLVPLLKANPSLSLKDVTDETRAGGACASCCDDIEDAIDEWREELGIMPEVDWQTYTILGRSQAEWVLILDELISEYLENKEIKNHAPYGIESLKGHRLELIGPLSGEAKKDLQAFIKKKAEVFFLIGTA